MGIIARVTCDVCEEEKIVRAPLPQVLIKKLSKAGARVITRPSNGKRYFLCQACHAKWTQKRHTVSTNAAQAIDEFFTKGQAGPGGGQP